MEAEDDLKVGVTVAEGFVEATALDLLSEPVATVMRGCSILGLEVVLLASPFSTVLLPLVAVVEQLVTARVHDEVVVVRDEERL